MRIGLVGKPNVGKSTTFAALTETAVEIANYPFTTIEANIGVAYISAPHTCPCADLRMRLEDEGRPPESGDLRGGSICGPRRGACVGHTRLVPITLVDVAGLVPDAHLGRGRGNQFLNDLANCDALIQVVDGSGGTDIEGNPVGPGASTPEEEHDFLIEELTEWIDGIISSGWAKALRRIQSEKDGGLSTYLGEQLSGIGADAAQVAKAMSRMDDGPPVSEWGVPERKELSRCLREEIFPLYIAANKADLADDSLCSSLRSRVVGEGGMFQLCSAETELALRRAAKAGAIRYTPGESGFEVNTEMELSGAQRRGLAELADRLLRMDGTGLDRLLKEIVYSRLGKIVAYPVQDETHWTDGDGVVLPDALLVTEGTTAKELAYAVHSDLGDGFIRAVDGRTGMVVSSDYSFEDGAVIKIHSKT